MTKEEFQAAVKQTFDTKDMLARRFENEKVKALELRKFDPTLADLVIKSAEAGEKVVAHILSRKENNNG